MTTFSAQVDSFVRETKERMLVMSQYALSDMIEDMQVPTKKGGRMRVKTGFLRASGRGAIGNWPEGNGVRPADAQPGQYGWDGQSLNAVLLDMKLGDTFYWGWVANYGAVRELYDGFMEAPLQNWQGYVNSAVKRVKDDVNAG